MYEEVRKSLLNTPVFRERKYKDHFITILAFRGAGVIGKEEKIKSHDKITATIEDWKKVMKLGRSYDRAWRQVTSDIPSLRGSDYDQKEELEQEAQIELGYKPMSSFAADKVLNDI